MTAGRRNAATAGARRTGRPPGRVAVAAIAGARAG